MNRRRRMMVASVGMALIFGLLNVAAALAVSATCQQSHNVRVGETLSEIGKQYGVSWPALAALNSIPNANMIYAGSTLCISAERVVAPIVGQPVTRIPTINITSVDPGKSVTIQTANYPANTNFEVRMGAFGTRGINGIKVGTLNSGAGGTVTETFSIPDALKGAGRVAIRLDSTSSGHFSYNWFWNGAATSTTGTTGSTAAVQGTASRLAPGTIPTFSILSVVRGEKVVIQAQNFPANDTFDVRMGAMGTRGVGGVKVRTFNSDKGGTFTAEFQIPEAFRNAGRIAIRLESPVTGYYSYNWFYNNTTSP